MKKEELSTSNIIDKLNNPQWFDIYVEEKLESTSTLLKTFAKEGAKEGTVIIAKEQTAGRGRLSRKFYSPKDNGIYMSILFKPDLPIDKSILLTCMTAVAVSEVIDEYIGQKTSIKWVNDIELSGRKICGILTEGTINYDGKCFDHVVVGIGINVIKPKEGYPVDISNKAGAIFDKDNFDYDIRIDLIAKILERLKLYYSNLTDEYIKEKYKKKCNVIGEDIYVISGEDKYEGHVLDITNDLNLLVETKSGKKVLQSGEISIRRRVDNLNINDI